MLVHRSSMFITNLQVCSNNQENCIWQIRPTWIYGCFYLTDPGSVLWDRHLWRVKGSRWQSWGRGPHTPLSFHSAHVEGHPVLWFHYKTIWVVFGAEQTHGHGQSVSIPHSGGPKGPLSAPEDRHQSRQRQGRSDSFHLRLNSFTVLYCRIYRNLTGERLHWKYR